MDWLASSLPTTPALWAVPPTGDELIVPQAGDSLSCLGADPQAEDLTLNIDGSLVPLASEDCAVESHGEGL